MSTNQSATKALLAMGICSLAFWPVWIWYIDRLQDGSDEPFGLIALAVAVLVLVLRRSELHLSVRGLVGGGSIILFTACLAHWLPPLVEASLALLAIGFVSGTLGRHPGVWALAFLSLPLVASLQFYLGYPFRLFAAVMADTLLAPMPFEVTREGTNLLLNGEVPVGVDPACSGVRMLWMGLFFGMALATFKRLGWIQTLLVGFVCLLGVLIGNGFRVSFLFIKESGLISLPDWTHEGIGLAVFLVFVWLLLLVIDRLSPQVKKVMPMIKPIGNRGLVSFGIVAVLLAFVNVVGGDRSVSTIYAEPDWPTHWGEHVLEPVPMTEGEQAFAAGFPGKMATFKAGYETVILRWVVRPTRQLHSSADCLRAMGYYIEVEKPGRFIAIDRKQGDRFEVTERIYNDTYEWKEISAWFWDGALQRTKGPWWATTVIRPL